MHRLVNRQHCTHDECAELRRIISDAFRLGRFDLINYAERALAGCAPQASSERRTRYVADPT